MDQFKLNLIQQLVAEYAPHPRYAPGRFAPSLYLLYSPAVRVRKRIGSHGVLDMTHDCFLG